MQNSSIYQGSKIYLNLFFIWSNDICIFKKNVYHPCIHLVNIVNQKKCTAKLCTPIKKKLLNKYSYCYNSSKSLSVKKKVLFVAYLFFF